MTRRLLRCLIAALAGLTVLRLSTALADGLARNTTEEVMGLGGPFQSAPLQVRRTTYVSGRQHLVIEFLDDDLVHVQLSASGFVPDSREPIPTTPMVQKTDYPGPSNFSDDGTGRLETSEIKVRVDLTNLCVAITDKALDPDLPLTTICPVDLTQDRKGVTIAPNGFTHVYGLGQQFVTAGSADGDWFGRVRSSSDPFGNAMESWNGGFVGNTQIPVAYFLGQNSDSYALFIDSQYKQVWDFISTPWNAEIAGPCVRLYVMTGPNLDDLRRDYMELAGRPPVPPKKMFGLWVSEYGFDDWAELDDKLRTLRANHFPIDGLVLDLQWFGGMTEDSDDSAMGSLTWDVTRFPDPRGQIASLWDNEGVGIMLVEEAYVSKNQPAHGRLESQGYLVRDCETCTATYLTSNPWWGKGGMLDWTNDAAGAFWHDWKREPLIQAGVIGHWTDLGEPELYNPRAWYWGISVDDQPTHGQADIHNLYNLKWSQSIHEGYARHGRIQRPFILSRSGTSGSQRYGVAMWSGDIASNLTSLATQLNVQMHMSFSGVDYFGADIGGFYRAFAGGDLGETYTQWLADGMAFDIPARPHTENRCNCRETAPDRVGDLQSNLENVRQRYELTPYLYSLAHRAYLYGEPVVPPLVFYYPADLNVRKMGDEKLLGRDLLVAAVAAHGEAERRVYLPAGDWVNYHTREWFHSAGDWFGPFPELRDGRFKLPMFARAGAVIPLMYVDERTMNVLGQRIDGSRRDELIVRVYADPAATTFTLYEDDGQTIAYQNGALRTTTISQQQIGDRVIVTIDSAAGTFAGAPARRDNLVELVLSNLAAGSVVLNGVALPQVGSRAELNAAARGWCDTKANLVVAKSGSVDVAETKTFEFDLDIVSTTGAATQVPTTEGEPSAQNEPASSEQVNLWQFGLVVLSLLALILASLLVRRYQDRRHIE